MNPRAILSVVSIALGMAFGLAGAARAGVLVNEAKEPVHVQAGYYDSNVGFQWGQAVVLQPGQSVAVEDGDRVFVRARTSAGEFGIPHHPAQGAARDYLFTVGPTVYYDVTRRQ